MRPFLSNGWLAIPYSGPDVTLVRIGVAAYGAEPSWTPAFLDYIDGVRVAKIRASAVVGRPSVWLETGGNAELIGPYPS